MKRLLALLLAAMMLLSASAALAAEYTLDEKMQMQVRDGSGLKLSASFTVTPGARMTALNQAANTILTAMLPGATLDLRYIRGVSTQKGQENMNLVFNRAGRQLADIHYTTDGILEAVSSEWLGTQGYSSLKGDGLLLALFTGEGGKWPGLERAVFAMNGADNQWRSDAERALKPYLDGMSLWLQSYSKTGTLTDGEGRSLTNSLTQVPVAQLKAQMKKMLGQLYADGALLTLLRQQFSAREAAAYLEPSMMTGFSAAIDALPLVGEVRLQRAYDQTGNVVVDELQLPMGGARGLEHLSYRFDLNKEGQRSLNITAAKVKKAAAADSGESMTLHMEGAPLETQTQGMETGAYKGSLQIIPESGAFTVGGTAPPPEERRIDFELSYRVDKEVLDNTAQQSTRDYRLDLTLSPVGIEGVSGQKITATGQLKSGVNSRSATNLSGQIIWQDLGTQGSITMYLTGATAAPWAIPTVASLNAMRLDSLTEGQLRQQRQNFLTALQAGLSRLTASFLVAPSISP